MTTVENDIVTIPALGEIEPLAARIAWQESISSKLVDDTIRMGIDVNQISVESFGQDYTLITASGLYPFFTLSPQPGESAVVDASAGRFWVLDTQHIPPLGFIPLAINNWPSDKHSLRLTTKNMVPGGVAIIWPPEAILPFPPIGPGQDNEFDIGSDDGGLTVNVRRVGCFRSINY